MIDVMIAYMTYHDKLMLEKCPLYSGGQSWMNGQIEIWLSGMKMEHEWDRLKWFSFENNLEEKL